MADTDEEGRESPQNPPGVVLPDDQEEPPSPPVLRGRRLKRLADLADRHLTTDTYALVADPNAGRISALFFGSGLEHGRADAIKAALSIQRLAGLFTAIADARAEIFAFTLAHSIEIDLGPNDDELIRARRALWAAEREQDQARRRRYRLAAVPETTLAGYATVDLIEESRRDVVGAALSYATSVTEAYKSFIRLLANEDLSVELALPYAQEAVQLSSREAEEYKVRLARTGTTETLPIRATGLLSMADAAAQVVRLRLDRNRAQDAALKNRRTITARYTAEAGRKIRDRGLWGNEVQATFDMTRDKREATTSARPAQFVLTDANALYT